MLLAAARARAAASGRSYCTPDDVKALAPAVISHRIIPAAGAARSENGFGSDGAAKSIVRDILSSVPVTEAV
jgi:MoxR-like ATPase